MNLNLLSTMPAALVWSVNDDLLNKFVHDLRRQLGDMLMLLYCSDESSHIGGLLFGRTNEVTTVCNGRRKVWTDYEEAKAYFLEMMMSTDGEEHERAECVYIQLLHGLEDCSDEDEY